MPVLPLPIPIYPTDRVHSVGDSFIFAAGNTPDPGTGVISQLAPMVWNVQTASVRATLGRRQRAIASGAARTGDSPALPTLIPWTQNGVSGTGIEHIDANIQTRVIDYNPTLLFILVSQNNWAVDQATWDVYANSIMTTLGAQLPACRVVWVGCLSGGGELWTTASGWGSNPHDADCARISGYAHATAAAYGCYWLDIRGVAISDPDTILNWEATHNLPEPGLDRQGTQLAEIGPRLTHDGAHLTIYYGQQREAEMMFTHLDLSAL